MWKSQFENTVTDLIRYNKKRRNGIPKAVKFVSLYFNNNEGGANMKKTLSILLALAMACGLTACGGSPTPSQAGGASTEPASSQQGEGENQVTIEFFQMKDEGTEIMWRRAKRWTFPPTAGLPPSAGSTAISIRSSSTAAMWTRGWQI